MEVIFKEGMLYLQGVKFGKRTWRKIWLVLFKASSTGVGRLEFYTLADSTSVTDQRKISRQKAPERKVVRLSDCLSVTPAPKGCCPAGCTAFSLKTTQCTYILASTTSQDWLSALNLLAFQKDPGESDKGDFEGGNDLTMEDNDLYSSWKRDVTLPPNQYKVTVQSTEASKKCRLSGEYVVSPDREAVILLSISTGQIIYRWPYSFLRKFGQVEGGFSIEAGRRCESGEGVFTFLTRHSPHIYQAIFNQCSVQGQKWVKPVSVHRTSLPDVPPVLLPATAKRPAGPPHYSLADVSADTEDDSDDNYATINHISVQNVQQLSHFSSSKEAVGDDVEDNEEQCYSLETLNLADIMDENIYYNLRRATPPLIKKDQHKAETYNPESIYSDVKKKDSSPNLQLQPLSSSLIQPVLHPAPCTLIKSVPIPKPRNQHLPPVNNYIQTECSTQAQAGDDVKETEEAISSSARATPTEDPGSFKYKLAEIFSKDLAKF
ncbi:docking protein 3 [Embiotoca jacksoni]|uniref:docking protein 3 n=1 Tax=Embiotoca jacksoni TaxID=100190 RepID=UPI0037038106